MAAKQWDEFDRLLDGKLTSMLYPRYNRDYLRLNSYLLREDHKRADEMFDLLLGLNLPKMQRVDLVIKAFNYYVGQEDRKRPRSCCTRSRALRAVRPRQSHTNAS